MIYPKLDDSEQWLRNNDPFYKKKNRLSILEYPYHTHTQTRYRDNKEVPESSLSVTKRLTLKCYESGREDF